MEETLRAHLFELADAFEKSTGVSRPSIGKAALRDNTFFRRLSAGDGFTIKTFDKLIQWFSDNWPDEQAWPESFPRPARSNAENAA